MLSKFGCVSLETLSFGVAADLDGSETDNTGVNSASDAVLLLDVNLGK